MANKLFATKSIDKLLLHAETTKNTFKRTLGVNHLVLLGIGAIIGAVCLFAQLLLHQSMQAQLSLFPIS
jgi:amino acid permease